MSKKLIEISPVSKSVPFDNTTNGFVSTEAQSAIEEAKSVAASASRGPTTCGFDGNAGTGRWLEFYSNNPSNNNPFIVAEPAEIVSLSVSAAANSTGTVTIFRNGVSLQTISLSANRKARVKSLAHALTDLDELSVQITSGSISRPVVYLFIRTLP